MDVYIVHPCMVVGIDKGKLLLAECQEDSPDILCWGLYKILSNGLLEWVSDHTTEARAMSALRRKIKNASIKTGQEQISKIPVQMPLLQQR